MPVGGVEDHHVGVAFAAQEAVRRGCDIEVVHVGPGPAALLPPAGPIAGSFTGPISGVVIGQGDVPAHAPGGIVERTVEAARRSLGRSGPAVRGRLTHGPVVPVLVEDSRQVDLVVLSRRHARGAASLSAMTVANAVAAHAHAPVAVVPPRWSPGTTTAPVVIAIAGGPTEAREVLRAGLTQARRCGARAEAVHGWWYSDAYDDLARAHATGTTESARRHARLTAELAAVLAEFPDVDTRLTVSHGRPDRVLVEAAERAQVVVVGRHRPVLPFGSDLGPLTRLLMCGAGCPVLVVNSPTRAPGTAGTALGPGAPAEAAATLRPRCG
nr:universal stress protein [Nocardioides ochotonae]